MIMCDYCSSYYHIDCLGLGITESEAETMDSFICKFCTEKGSTSPIYKESKTLKQYIFAIDANPNTWFITENENLNV